MADIQPTDYLVAPSINRWGFIQVPKDNAVYDFLDQVKQTIDPAFMLINTGLGILQSILDFVSSLLIDITQPIKLAIDALIALLEGLIRDLKSAGVYFSWDYDLFSNPIKNLSGGYPAYESRYTQRLLDKKDLTRPDFSAQTSVFGLAVFGGADTNSINRLIKNLSDFFALFGATPQQNSLRSVSNLTAKYYQKFGPAHTELNPADIDLDNKPSGIRITWEYPSVNLQGIATPPPMFVISVKTTSKKETIHFKVAQPSSTGTGSFYEGVLQDPANPRLDAGGELLSLLGNSVGDAKDKVYLKAEDGTITDTLDKYYESYRTFFLEPQSVIGQLFGPTSYAIDIPFEALPTGGDGAYIISIRSCTETTLQPADTRELEGTNAYEGKPSTLFLKADLKAVPRINITPTSLSLPSVEVTIPRVDSDIKLQYASALKEALALFALCRLDTKEGRDFLGLQVSDYQVEETKKHFDRSNRLIRDRVQQMVALKGEIDRAVSQLLPASPSDSVLAPLRTHIENLNNKDKGHIPFYKFIVEALTSTAGRGDGIGKDIALAEYYSLNETSYEGELESNLQVQAPQVALGTERSTEEAIGAIQVDLNAPQVSPIKVTEVKGLFSPPIIYCSNKTLRQYIRNPLTPTQFYARAVAQTQGVSGLCESALRVLSVVVPKEKPTGQWLNLRLGDFVGLSGVVDALDDLSDYARALSAGLAGIIETIKKYIAQVKNRIDEIQRILAKIKAVLDAILSFRLPAGLYILPFTGNGTTDATASFMNAQNKPYIVGGYGAGGMIVFGGLPSLLVDFFTAIIGGE